VAAFERAMADALGMPETLALSSCTAALHLALVTAGVGPGDEVIVPSLTFAATANVVEHLGARAVFADVLDDVLTLDPEDVARRLGPRTRAVIAVDYAGHPAELDDLRALCRTHDLLFLEDAAHSFGARSRGRAVGTGGHPVAFSFYATKNLTTGEGGLLAADSEFLERARPLALHGLNRDAYRRYERGASWSYTVLAPGYKYNMTDLEAALGLVQLARFPALQERRRRLAMLYDAGFADCPLLRRPECRPDVESAYHLYPVRLALESLTADRATIVDALRERGLGVSVHFLPLHEQPYYRERYGLTPQDLPRTHDAGRRLLSLPFHPGLTDEDAEDVIAIVRDVLERYRR
jgi:dTDP-4-amino-4,6-dideoxygalactose transaminase